MVEGKAGCKAWLQEKAGLAERPDVPLFAQIGRLDPQKGWDLLAEVADRLLAHGRSARRAGRRASQVSRFARRTSARRHPGRFWAYLGFADELAHQIEAGADLFLMPSLFEPCGLNQLYSLAHGTVPIVRATGGLADTVVDASPRDPRRRHGHRVLLHRAHAASALADDRAGAGALARPRRLGQVDADRDERRLVLGPQRPGVYAALRGDQAQGPVPNTRHPTRADRPAGPSPGGNALSSPPRCSEHISGDDLFFLQEDLNI